MIFPTVQGTSVAGNSYVIPFDLEGEFNLLLLGFEPSHQYLLNTWVGALESLESKYSRFRYYELATFPNYDQHERDLIDDSMQQAILESKMRQIIVSIFVDKVRFAELLQLPNELTIYVLLVDHSGNILWRSQGRMTTEKIAALRTKLEETFKLDNELL